MSDKKENKEISFFSPKGESNLDQPKKEEPKSSGVYEGRPKNKICNDGKDWKDLH